ncbi:hypothetical protein N1Z41_00032865 [Pseudomonas aeruginosa]
MGREENRERDQACREELTSSLAPDAGYMQRVGERVKRIEAAQSPDEIAAILAEISRMSSATRTPPLAG